MVIMAIDPSFKCLAYSIYDGNGTIYMNSETSKLGENMGFDKVYHAVHSQWDKLKEDLDKLKNEHGVEVNYVISEIPPPVSQFSAGLYALDTYILSKLYDTYKSIKEIYFISPSYLGTIHGTSKYKKSDSTNLAKYYLTEVFGDSYNLVIPDSVSDSGRKIKGKINNDRAESFLFLLRMFVKYNIDDRALQISSVMQGLGYEAEKLLCERS